MAIKRKSFSLIDNVDSSQISSASLNRTRHLVHEHQNDYLRQKTNHCPVQLDKGTFKLLKGLKATYGVYYYDAIKESLLLMSVVLKNKNKRR